MVYKNKKWILVIYTNDLCNIKIKKGILIIQMIYVI